MRQEYRDRTGSLLGYRERRGDRVDCRDRTGSLVGSYYPARNETRDRYGSWSDAAIFYHHCYDEPDARCNPNE